MAWYYDTATDLRVPDLGRNKNMVFPSWHLHMLYTEDGYDTHLVTSYVVTMHESAKLRGVSQAFRVTPLRVTLDGECYVKHVVR